LTQATRPSLAFPDGCEGGKENAFQVVSAQNYLPHTIARAKQNKIVPITDSTQSK
jgi:hypothetical protein